MDVCQDSTAYCCFSQVQHVSAVPHTKVTNSSGNRHRIRLTGFHWHLTLDHNEDEFSLFPTKFLCISGLE